MGKISGAEIKEKRINARKKALIGSPCDISMLI
jgi:hypothetical protein